LLTNIGITTASYLIGGILFVALPFWIITQLRRRQI
jgi:formate/nitrite transporter FocA (FNT family)